MLENTDSNATAGLAYRYTKLYPLIARGNQQPSSVREKVQRLSNARNWVAKLVYGSK